MKVVCIDDTLSGKKIFELTVGKVYDVEFINPSAYLIEDDRGKLHWYSTDVLIPLEELRKLKLKELGL